jgi:transcription termination/antitermination protein NusG
MQLPWYAVHVRSCHELSTATALRCQGYEVFLPQFRLKRKWSDRVKEIDTPLFAGYVFCRADVTKRLPILTTPGVVRMIGLGRVPTPVDESEIHAIQTLIQSGRSIELWRFISAGDYVRIEDGPLAGLVGYVLQCRNTRRFVVSVCLLQRSVAVELPPSDLMPLRGLPSLLERRSVLTA